MYRTYTTDGLVLGSRDSGEANKYYFILTRELGLVSAFAQGVRELKSKLRYSLAELSYVKVSLVRGKEKWRLTSTVPLPDLDGLRNSGEKKKIAAKLTGLIRRLVGGEEEDQELFDELISSLKFLSAHDLSTKSLHDYELLAVLRILDKLGYISPRDNWLNLLGGRLWEGETLPNIEKERKILLATINESLYHSQL